MVDRRTEILSGELSFPAQIIKLLNVDDIELNDAQNNDPKKRPAIPLYSFKLFVTKYPNN